MKGYYNLLLSADKIPWPRLQVLITSKAAVQHRLMLIRAVLKTACGSGISSVADNLLFLRADNYSDEMAEYRHNNAQKDGIICQYG